MKNFSKLAVMIICLLLTTIFTSACGGGSKATPPNYPYWLLTQNNQQENNNQEQNNNQQEENNNQQEENNNQQEENNQEEQEPSVEVTLTLTDSLNSENIAKADIFYKVESTTKSTDNEDKEILQAEPNVDDNTKFTTTISGTDDPNNVKIKAILTYDSEENLLDYFSSYDGVEATNGIFDVDFENSKDNEKGFGGGTGTKDDPFIISAPRHFVNINKKDGEGNYLYLDQNYYFKQTADIDFTHLTGLKINKAEEDKDITVDVINEKAPFYNDGHGIEPIGDYSPIYPVSNHMFQGVYDGDDHIIDGIVMVNVNKASIGLFSIIVNSTVQKLIIGENSIFFFNKFPEWDFKNGNETSKVVYSDIGTIIGTSNESNIEQCENRAKILISKAVASEHMFFYLTISSFSRTYDTNSVKIENCTNTGNITIDSCQIDEEKENMAPIQIGTFNASIEGEEITNRKNNTNEGSINVTNNKFIKKSEGLYILSGSDKFINKGHIIVDNNTNIINIYTSLNYVKLMNDSTNDGHITITNNKLDDGLNNAYIFGTNLLAGSFSNCVNNGYIFIDNNSGYKIQAAKNIYGNNIEGSTNNGKVTVNGVEGEI